jgi:hypothetical protein
VFLSIDSEHLRTHHHLPSIEPLSHSTPHGLISITPLSELRRKHRSKPHSTAELHLLQTADNTMASPPESSIDGAERPLSKLLSRVDLDGHNLPPSPAPSSPSVGRRRYALATELVYTETKDQYGASSIPIYQSATFKQTSSAGGQEYDYTRSGNSSATWPRS